MIECADAVGLSVPRAGAGVSLGFLVMTVVKREELWVGVVKYIIKHVSLLSLIISLGKGVVVEGGAMTGTQILVVVF